MLDTLLDSWPFLAFAIAAIAATDYLVALSIARMYARQQFVAVADWQPPGLAGKPRSEAARLALSLPGTALVVVIVPFMDRSARELIGAGYLVLQLATLALNATNFLSVAALRPDAAEGHLRYTAAYRYKAAAAGSVGISVITGSVALLFGSRPFLVGTVLLLAIAIGWRRRAWQASRASP